MTITYPRPWPIGMGIQKSRFGLSPNQALFEGVLSRKVSVQSHAAGKTDRWEGVLTTRPAAAADHARLRAWFLSLDGRAKTVSLYDPDRREARSGVKPGGGFTNYLRDSSALDSWPDARLGVTGPTTNGTLGFDHFTLLPTTANGVHQIKTPLIPIKAGQQYALTIHVAASGYEYFQIFSQEYDADGVLIGTLHNANVNTTTGLAVASGSDTTASATALGSGWHRLTAVATMADNAAFIVVTMRVWESNGVAVYAGDGIKDILAAGPQLEEGPVFTAYEASTTGPVVKGAAQGGTALITDGWRASSTVLLAGDYFQLGSQYFMAVADAAWDSGGAATLNFRPALRASPADNAGITILNPALVARLQLPDIFWEIDQTGLGSFSFAFEEVL